MIAANYSVLDGIPCRNCEEPCTVSRMDNCGPFLMWQKKAIEIKDGKSSLVEREDKKDGKK